MEDTLENLLNQLNGHNKIIIGFGKKMLETNGMFVFDIFCIAILNRSVNLIRGYSLLLRDQNFIAAAPLVRLHLDSLLRIFAPTLIDYDVDDFVQKIMSGKSLRYLCDKENKLLTDNYLKNKLSEIEGFDWVAKIYNDGNRYIHLTDKHIFASSGMGKTPRSIVGGIRLNDEFISPDEKIAATKCLIRISEGILYFIKNWIAQKQS